MIEKVFHLFKIVKEYFTDTRIRLKNLDAAFVIREDGVQELYTPKLPELPEDDIIPENMLILTSIAYNMRDEKWINDTVLKLTKGIEDLRGGELGSTETGNSLPDSWAGHDASTNSLPDFLHFHFTMTDEEKASIDAANKETLRQLEEAEKEVDKAKAWIDTANKEVDKAK